MAKQSALERAIQNLDEKIATLQFARQHLIEQQHETKAKPSRPRAVVHAEEGQAS